MTAAEEPTLYEVLEVDPASSLDELRAAVERARETYGAESLAVYALVDEGQLDELRAKLDEAASVLLDATRRASYDRSIGRIGPAMLWAEDDDEDEAALPPVQPAPHSGAPALELEASEADDEEPAPRQQALALEVSESPGPFGRGAERAGAAAAPSAEPVPEVPAGSAPLLAGDWAAAVPSERHAARPAPEPQPEPARASSAKRGATRPETEELRSEGAAGPEVPGAEEAAPETTALPLALGLRIKPAPPPVAATAEEAPAPSPPPAAVAPEHPPELPSRPRESRLRLDLPSDVEFNGELLRRVRESYGFSLQQVAERTRITRIHLENVEADRYDRLPATVYLRGILVNLARELRLDPARVSKTYLLAAQRSHARVP